MNYFVGIEIKRGRKNNKMLLNQTNTSSERFNMQISKPMSTPADTNKFGAAQGKKYVSVIVS